MLTNDVSLWSISIQLSNAVSTVILRVLLSKIILKEIHWLVKNFLNIPKNQEFQQISISCKTSKSYCMTTPDTPLESSNIILLKKNNAIVCRSTCVDQMSTLFHSHAKCDSILWAWDIGWFSQQVLPKCWPKYFSWKIWYFSFRMPCRRFSQSF